MSSFVAGMHLLNTLVPQWMEAAGGPRDKVTHVVMTHHYSDHVGWSTVLENGRWVPTFHPIPERKPEPDRRLETGAAGTGQADGARDPQKPEPGTTTQGKPDGDRDATTSGGAGQAETSRF